MRAWMVAVPLTCSTPTLTLCCMLRGRRPPLKNMRGPSSGGHTKSPLGVKCEPVSCKAVVQADAMDRSLSTRRRKRALACRSLFWVAFIPAVISVMVLALKKDEPGTPDAREGVDADWHALSIGFKRFLVPRACLVDHRSSLDLRTRVFAEGHSHRSVRVDAICIQHITDQRQRFGWLTLRHTDRQSGNGAIGYGSEQRSSGW